MLKSFLLFSFFILVACSSTTDRELDGGKHQVQCLTYVGNCHERARNICPDGYLVTNRVRPTKVDSGETRFTLNIKCRKPLY